MNAQAMVEVERATRARWATSDAAIFDAVLFSPLRGRGIDYFRVLTTSDGAAVAPDAISRVLAVLVQSTDREQQVLVGPGDGPRALGHGAPGGGRRPPREVREYVQKAPPAS